MIDPDYHHDPISTRPSLHYLHDKHPGTGEAGWWVYGLSGGTDSDLTKRWQYLLDRRWRTWMDGVQGGKRTIVLYRKQDDDEDPQHDLDGPITDEWLMAVGAVITDDTVTCPLLKIGSLSTQYAVHGNNPYATRKWWVCQLGVYVDEIPVRLCPASRSSVLALVQYIEDNQ